MPPITHLTLVESTNTWLRNHPDTGSDLCVVAAKQTAGRGQGTNSWESEPGKNLTFSLLTHPKGVSAAEQYLLSMAMAVAVRDAAAAASPEANAAAFSIKWPNDIYWHDRKLAGILIECALHGSEIRRCITGVGLNVYQHHFLSDAPNPVALCQTGNIATDLLDNDRLLRDLLGRYAANMQRPEDTRNAYRRHLYRRNGLHPYRDAEGTFMAETVDVDDRGTLLLRDQAGRLRQYQFKQVQFIIPDRQSTNSKSLLSR
jgi:BirA family biotin operon repressor/biotin-[acetyl-CoA-carboxylase] ligase